ncbi:MAG: hypothetical protein ACFFBH_09105 [Promethearchaeota archaeon]
MKKSRNFQFKLAIFGLLILVSFTFLTPSYAQSQFNNANPVIIDGNNGTMELSLVGDGSISKGTNTDNTVDNPDDMVELSEEDKLYKIPNYNYSDANLNVYPKYYAKDETLKENFAYIDEERINLDYGDHQYISDVEAQISSVQYTVDPGIDNVQYLSGYERTYISGVTDMTWETGDISKLHDEDITTEVIEVWKSVIVPGVAVPCSADGAIFVGSEIRNSRMNKTGELEWDWNWDLESVSIIFCLEGEAFLGNLDVIAVAQYVLFQMDIMARTAEGQNYAIHIINPIIKQVNPLFQTGIQLSEIPGVVAVSGNVGLFYYTLDDSYFTNLTDINRYSSEVLGWNGTYGNPVITYRFWSYALENVMGYVAASHLGLNEFNSFDYTFRWNKASGELHRNSDVYLSEQFYGDDIDMDQNYFFSSTGHLSIKHGWDNRLELTENKNYFTLKTNFYEGSTSDYYEAYKFIVVHMEYLKIRYYSFIPYTGCDLEISGDPTTRNPNYWQYTFTEIDQTLLYNTIDSFAYINLSYLSLESWDVGWEYNASLVFAFHINIGEFIFEDTIPYYDCYGEYLYDLGFWYRDLIINWKEVQLKGVYLEELYIDNMLQAPDRIFLYNNDNNIPIWATKQSISKNWSEGESYESIAIKFYTEFFEPALLTLLIELQEQIFSKNHFNFTFSISDEEGTSIDSATIQMWWHGTDVSSDIQNIGGGLYLISLDPITVDPGEDSILLTMIASASGYEDAYFETYISVDPDLLQEGGVSPPGDLTLIITISVASAGAIIGIMSIWLIKRRKKARS